VGDREVGRLPGVEQSSASFPPGQDIVEAEPCGRVLVE
jgi:hypothetical protein